MKVCIALPAMRHFLKFVSTLLGAIPASAEMAIDEEKLKLASVRMHYYLMKCMVSMCSVICDDRCSKTFSFYRY